MCMVPRNSKRHDLNGKHNYNIYDSTCILKEKTCYIFMWLSLENEGKIPVNRLPINTGNINMFEFLFDAITSQMPPFCSEEPKLSISYIRYKSIYSYKLHNSSANKDTGGYIIKTEQPIDFFQGMNLFNCSKAGFVSYLHICEIGHECLEYVNLS